MPNIILFDFEVFKCDTLLGCIVLNGNNRTIFQSWDFDEIKKFYLDNQESIWIGHNNKHYDNFILQAIVKGQNPKEENDRIIKNDIKSRLTIPLIYYDLMGDVYYSLKVTEAYIGKNISETEVDFNLDRELTKEEKLLTEKYNRDDLEQTEYNFNLKKDDFILRLSMIKQFNLPLKDLSLTGTQIAAKILKVKKDESLEFKPVKPIIYKELKVENQELIDFYLNEDFRTTKKLKINLCGLEHTIGSGGIHAALKKCSVKKALYLDVSGYYNLIMLNYNLLPRSMSKKSRDLYDFMYHEQLKLKGVKGKELERSAYKGTLLSVFGAMINKFCDFYDPWNGLLVTITGQLFLVDLLEKLEKRMDILRLIQSNTDGIIVEPLDWSKEQEILDIVDEWKARTKFVINPKYIYNIVQRDVNNYLYQDEKGDIHTLGEAVGGYESWDKNMFLRNTQNSKQPFIIPIEIVNYFIYKKTPEETVFENINNIKAFQFICKRGSFEKLEYEKLDVSTDMISTEIIQHVNRVFAYNSDKYKCQIYKRNNSGKILKAKYQNLPDNVLVYNEDINDEENKKKLMSEIDYNYYIDRGYERIAEFIDFPEIKDITIYE